MNKVIEDIHRRIEEVGQDIERVKGGWIMNGEFFNSAIRTSRNVLSPSKPTFEKLFSRDRVQFTTQEIEKGFFKKIGCEIIRIEIINGEEVIKEYGN